MEYCMEARALKPRFFRELIMNPTQQEDFLFLNAPSNFVSSEEFSSVDCFFDFSCGEFKDHIEEHHREAEEEEDEEEKDSLSLSSQDRVVEDDNNSNSSSFYDSLPASELAVPDDDVAELEWVSHFVDDYSSEFSLLHPVSQEKPESHAKNGFAATPKQRLTVIPCSFLSKVPAKPRTKRPRPTGQTWSVGSPLTESSTSSSSSSSITSVASTPGPIITNAVQSNDLSRGLTEPPMKKPKKQPAVQSNGDLGSAQFQRRCSHCQVQKTPQWRTGPLGPKTLCNACGVRYKSGRLLPEYRPACSPTFLGDIHSNSHRKVLEMRKKKEMSGQ